MASGRGGGTKAPARGRSESPAAVGGTPAGRSGPTPQQKVAAMRRKAARRARLQKLAMIAAVVVVLAGGGTAIGVYYATREDPLAEVRTFSLARDHVQGTVTYEQTPPAGGPHNAVWLNCGVYSEPVANENAVHDLEHGAVWITYRPDLPQDQIDTLVSRVEDQTYETLSPYPGLPAPVVISAWDHQLYLDGADDPRLEAFVAEYKQGPQTPEPGAACTGGTGVPVG